VLNQLGIQYYFDHGYGVKNEKPRFTQLVMNLGGFIKLGLSPVSI